MKKKKIIGTLLASSIAITAAFTGCSLVTSNSTADMQQVIATVNISAAEGLSGDDSERFEKYNSAVGTTKIYKNELIAYYLNAGMSYVNSGYSYSTVFNMLVNSLVDTAVLKQYSIMYLLDKKAGTGTPSSVLDVYNAKETYAEKLEWLLTGWDEEDEDKEIKIARYSLYSSLNATIDSYEKQIIKEKDDSASGSGSRATPTGVDVTVDDYYPKATAENVAEGYEVGDLYYKVYTGYNGYQLADSGAYQDDAIKGSNKVTRTRAYNKFLDTLASNGLIKVNDDKLMNVDTSVEYIQKEYVSRLESRVINKYYDLYEEEKEQKLAENDYGYIQDLYEKLTKMQEYDEDSFSSTFTSLSDNTFVLHAPKLEDGEGAYGFVYNILLPFSSTQSIKLSELQKKYADEETGGYTMTYYNKRNDLMKQIKTTDQREAWFNGNTDYSFKATDKGFTAASVKGDNTYFGDEDSYLFFENNLTKKDQYDPLEKYIGDYAYNGKVYEKKDGGYELVPDELDIDGMLAEFKAYIEYVLGSGKVDYDTVENYYEYLTEDNFYTEDTKNEPKAKDKKINYENFIYASGKVTLPAAGADFNINLLNKESDQYKALAAVNELQYAYTTDTGVLSQYLGYGVTLGDTTGYIKEFEKAAQKAIEAGAGSFTVCAGDYGWHLIYVAYTFDSNGGAVYGETLNWADNVGVEGTFENFFYEFIKGNDIAEISTVRRTQIMTQFNIDGTTVKKYQSTYQDLLDLGS